MKKITIISLFAMTVALSGCAAGFDINARNGLHVGGGIDTPIGGVGAGVGVGGGSLVGGGAHVNTPIGGVGAGAHVGGHISSVVALTSTLRLAVLALTSA